MICDDREFPESARVLMSKGAEIIVTPNACELDEWRVSQFSTRAIENAVGVAMANYPRPKNNGQSCAFHPILFPEGGGRARDNLIVRAGPDEVGADGQRRSNRLGVDEFGPDAIFEADTLEWRTALLSGVVDVAWSASYRFAAVGRVQGHGGMWGG